MSLFTAPVYPRRAIGFLVLGASLHDILTRLKAEPQNFSKLDLIYSPSQPVSYPVIVNLPENGIRLRFDGAEQRLRLIEVTEFSKSKLTYNNIEITKPASHQVSNTSAAGDSHNGPNFRHVYHKLLGPTFPGEFVPPEPTEDNLYGLYVLSYPGIAFSFPLLKSAWQSGKDFVSLLSSSSTQPAASMAIFDGDSWAATREHIYTQTLQDPKNYAPAAKARESYPDEIGIVRIYGEGWLELERPWGAESFYLRLGNTTPQELVHELGPPDAIYRKSDQRMSIHRARDRSHSRTPSRRSDTQIHDDSTDTDHSSAHTATDVSEDDSDVGGAASQVVDECFYNYFYHGFDILISSPTTPSPRPPSIPQSRATFHPTIVNTSAPLVATKIILHSNVPGSYSFNRHRRCRWDISYLSCKPGLSAIDSEISFEETAKALNEEWKSAYANEEEASQRQRGMVLNRGWGNSPGSSCELLGGWEDSASGKRVDGPNVALDEEKGLGNTTLYGFPGLVFEVLKNGIVSGLTVF